MCTTCGCSHGSHTRITNLPTGQTGEIHPERSDHAHGPDEHQHHRDGHHVPPQKKGSSVSIEQALLDKNDRLAEQNRRWFRDHHIVALNLVSSPGSGKTTLLERTIQELQPHLHLSVIEGDQETRLDAERIHKAGCPVVQINTGAGCHLEADMLARGLKALQPASHSLILIENVGNLVCPALFDLGEQATVVILSVTEGEDKPLKYPRMFKRANLMLLNKIDLLPYVAFDVPTCVGFAHRVNPGLQVCQISATTGEGLPYWYDWVLSQIPSSNRQVGR